MARKPVWLWAALLLVHVVFTVSVAGMAKSATITRGTVVGGGRIGTLLYELNDKQDTFLCKREDTLSSTESGPIYLCTRNADLEAIINTCPAQRREDLIFLQNGVLTSYLQSKGLEGNTQGLIYFAVSKKGESPIDGITDLSPNGLTAVTGKWAEDFSLRLQKGGLKCHVLDKETWTVAMLEKHIWICAFMAIGAKHGGCTVGEVESKHNSEVRSLIDELGRAAAKKTKVTFPPGVADRLCAYARSVSHFPTALKEFEWRNGWFTDLTFESLSVMQADPCPKHTDIMQQQGLFFGARKAWLAKKQAESAVYTEKMEQLLMQRDYEDAIRQVGKDKDRSERAKARGDQPEIRPLTFSPTVLGINSPEVEEMMEAHELEMKRFHEEEARERVEREALEREEALARGEYIPLPMEYQPK